CCLELNSLSKAHNMSGWRLGMLAGEAAMVSEVLKVKSQMDSGIFRPLQLAAVEALGCGEEWFSELNAEYRKRREAAGHIFDVLGVRYDKASAGLFVWGKVPEKIIAASGSDTAMTAGERLSEAILHEAGVFITPGYIFGHNGENYIRASLCAPVPKLEKAAELIKSHLEQIENQVLA
ncbi:MAG: aminotransferase class I/II-fold pyridoxal phosphate-dependent enzyme, partial [Bacteroidales bacterium]|nr:aminotransferase class I/II-fold pyridoxal phosphate-dependent enzyme [Bacteroidales bacterium]